MHAKQLIQIVALSLWALTLNPAMAHGAGQPRHGGIVQVASDVNFELVAEADGATLYLVDHDKPMSSKGITGKLTVLQGGKSPKWMSKRSAATRCAQQALSWVRGTRWWPC